MAMRKLVIMWLAAVCTLTVVEQVPAVEIRVSGQLDIAFENYHNLDMPFNDLESYAHNRNNAPGSFRHQRYGAVMERFSVTADFIASENLKGTYQGVVGGFTWGGPEASGGGVLGGRSNNLSTYRAYIEWHIPRTAATVRMGQQFMALPSYTFGSPVLDETGTGILLSVPVTDHITLAPMWMRAVSGPRRGNAGLLTERTSDLVDVFALAAEFRYDGFSLSPWAAYVAGGRDGDILDSVPGLVPAWYSSDQGNVRTWFAGWGGELTLLDPWRFTVDMYYGSTKGEHDFTDRQGWYAAAGGSYDSLTWGKLGLRAWYASGDNGDWTDGSERAPSVAPSFDATTTFFDNAYSFANRNYGRAHIDGTWGGSLSWSDISFTDKLSHEISITYVHGTNSVTGVTRAWTDSFHPAEYLTSKDSLIEFDFNTTLAIYQNLSAVLELGYVMERFDGDAWGRFYGLAPGNQARFNDMWRGALTFRYRF